MDKKLALYLNQIHSNWAEIIQNHKIKFNLKTHHNRLKMRHIDKENMYENWTTAFHITNIEKYDMKIA